MNFLGRNFNQVQLDMLGANQARQMQKSGKTYDKTTTLLVVVPIIIVIFLLIIIFSLLGAQKSYVYYNGTLYIDHGYKTSYTEVSNLDGVESGIMTYVSTQADGLTSDFETNCEKFAGGVVYVIPNDSYQIIIRTPEFEFYRLVSAT